MRHYVKPILWIAAASGAVSALLVILLFLAPLLINLEPAKERVVTDISRAIGGRLDARSIDLHYFPHPSITLHSGSVVVPEITSGTFDSLSIYPEISMLLHGKIRIARLALERPDMQMSLPDLEKMEGPKQLSLKAIDDGVASVVAKVASQAPGLSVSIEKGSLTLLTQNRFVFRFHDIDGRASLHGKRLRIALGCNSNVWKNASLAIWLKPGEFQGAGRLQLTQLRPDLIAQNLLPLSEPRVEDAEVNLSLSFGADGVKLGHAEFQSDVPSATLRKGQQILTIKKVNVKGTVHQRGARTIVSVTELDSVYPQLAISGKLSADQASSQTSVELNSSEVDVESVRRTVLFLAGRVPAVRSVFEILKKGRVPELNLTSRGSTIHDLAREENIVIKGSITGGNIFLPDQRLDLEDVKGIATISRGIFEGKNIEARLGSAHGTKGLLRFDLKGKTVPFHLDIAVNADAAELPPYLKALVEDETFIRELDLIKEVRGDVSGRLVLDRRASGTQVSVDVQAFSVHALYQRFPYPLEMHGKFSYDQPTATIMLEDVSGKAGKSSFSQLSGQLSFEKEPYLGVTSAAGVIVLDEICPWLSSFESVKGGLERFGAVKGIVKLDALGAKGPLARPAAWQFKIKGHMENVAVAAPGFPGTVEVKRGNFEAGREQLSLSDFDVRFQDASLMISGVLNHSLEGLDRADLSLQGEMGKLSVLRVSELIHLPHEARIRSPLSVSHTHLLWERNGKTSFSGNLGVKRGPEISVDVLSKRDELLVKQLAIRDARSNASLSFHQKGREFDLTFNGILRGATIDELLEKNEILTDWIKGNLSTRIILDQPFNSMAQGTLQGAGLNCPWSGVGPMRIGTFSLNAQDNLFTVESNLLVQGHSLRAKGKVDFLADGFVFDMNLVTDGLDLDQLIMQVRDKNVDGVSRTLPLKGILRIEPEYVKYGRFTWRPVRANLTFDPRTTTITITKADMCAIDTTGLLEISPKGLQFHSKARARDQDLRQTLVCLLDNKDISGHFSLDAEVSGNGKVEDLDRSLKGTLGFTATNGSIRRFGVLAKIFQVISPTGILKIPNLSREGFSYHVIKASGNLQDGKITIKEALLDSSATDLLFNGTIDLIDRKIDAVVLVVPFRTIDRIINFIPLVRYVLSGRVVAIPVKVTGELDDPVVTPFPPSAIAAEVLNTMKRILHLPFKLIQPLLPGEGKKESS